MYKKITGIFILLLSTILSGCAALTHFNQERSLDANKVFFIDAKQRAIFSVKKKEGNVSWEGICAEPAPDVISSLASTLGIAVTVGTKAKLDLTESIAEGVGSIGIRTAAIEALRDIMYRNCEAYAIGGISKTGIETLQRRFQSTMVAILAIEQLTGAVRAPAVVLAGSSSTGSADAIADLTNKTEIARKSSEDAKLAEVKSKEKYDAAVITVNDAQKKIDNGAAEAKRIESLKTPSEEEKKKLADYTELKKTQEKNIESKTTLEKEYGGAQQNTKSREQAFNALESSRVASLTGGGKASTTGQIESMAAKPALSDEAAKAVATAVVDIVKNTTSELAFSKELCTTLLGNDPNIVPQAGSALAECITLLKTGQMMMNN